MYAEEWELCVQWNLDYPDPFGHGCLVIRITEIVWIIQVTAEHTNNNTLSAFLYYYY